MQKYPYSPARVKVCETDCPWFRRPESHGSAPDGSRTTLGLVCLTGFVSRSHVVVCGAGRALTQGTISPSLTVTSAGSNRSRVSISTVTATTGLPAGEAAGLAEAPGRGGGRIQRQRGRQGGANHRRDCAQPGAVSQQPLSMR